MKWDVQIFVIDTQHVDKLNLKFYFKILYTPLLVLREPWIDISMDFMLGLSRSKKGRNPTFIVMDKFSKIEYFIYCHKIDDTTNITNLFLERWFGSMT